MNYKPKAEQLTVVTAGTRVPLSASRQDVRSVTIQADPDNASGELIYVGGADVDATHCLKLAPGESVTLEQPSDPASYINLALAYIDGSTDGLIANILYLTRNS